MERLIAIIEAATAALPTREAVIAESKEVSARDWAGFFKALADFAAKLLPLLIPLFVATHDQDG